MFSRFFATTSSLRRLALGCTAVALCILPLAAMADGVSAIEVTVVESGCYGTAAVGAAEAVHSGPGEEHPVLDELPADAVVYVCERRDDWRGIVYSPTGSDCGLNEETAGASYRGSCRSGWLPAGAVSVTAG